MEPEETHMHPPRRIASWVTFVLALLASGAVLLIIPRPLPAAPAITWTPSSVSQTAVAGASKSLSVSFTSSANVNNIAVWVVPELQPYLRVTPSSFSSIRAGLSYTLTITIAPAATTTPGTVDGTIHLRSADNPPKTFAKPLSVTLSVIWPSVTLSDVGLVVNYPASFTPTISQGSSESGVGFYRDLQAYSQGIPPIFNMTVAVLPQGLTLRQWIQSFGVKDADIISIATGNWTYLRWFESIGDGMGVTTASTLIDATHIINFTSPDATLFSDSQFLMMLGSFTAP